MLAFSITVAACHSSSDDPNNAPVAVDSTLETTEDQSGSVAVTITDADNEPLTVTISRPATKGGVAVSGTGPFTFVFTPTANANGADSFEYSVRDARGGSDRGTVAVSIAAVADPPTIDAATFELDEDDSRSVRIAASDGDGDTLTLSIVTAPMLGTAQLVNAATGDLLYTPPEDFNGDETFVVRASDGTFDSANATITMRVRAINDPPVAGADNATIAATGDTTIDVLANDVDVDGGPLGLEVLTQPPGASVTVVGSAISVTPAAGAGGPTEFSYRIRDTAGVTSSATVRLVIGSFSPVYFMSDDEVPGEQRLYRYDYFSRTMLDTPVPADSRLDGFATGGQGDLLVYISRTAGPPVRHRLWVKNIADPTVPVSELPTDSTFFTRFLEMSPDGESVIYNDQWAKVTSPQQFGSIDSSVERPTFSRDSQTIFYTQLAFGGGRVIKRKATGAGSGGTPISATYSTAQGLGIGFMLTPDETKVVSTGLFLHPAVSPGPMQSAYVSPTAGTLNDQRLHPMHTVAGDHAEQPRVTADSRYAYYLGTLGGVSGIYATDLTAPGVAVRLDVNPNSLYASEATAAADSRTVFYSLRDVGWFHTRIDQPGSATPFAPLGPAALALRSVTLAPDGSAIVFSSNMDTYVTGAPPFTTATLLHDDPGTIGVERIRYASDSNTALIVGASAMPRRVLVVSPKIPGWVQELGSASAGGGVRCVAFQGESCRM